MKAHRSLQGRDPAVVLRTLLATARRAEMGFAEAWAIAVEQAAAVAASPASWRVTFEETRSAWVRSYERQAETPADAAFVVLAESRQAEEGGSRRRCWECGAWLSVEADHRALYCSARCKRVANYRREQRRAGDRTDAVFGRVTVRA
jgi:hypothetical protein